MECAWPNARGAGLYAYVEGGHDRTLPDTAGSCGCGRWSISIGWLTRLCFFVNKKDETWTACDEECHAAQRSGRVRSVRSCPFPHGVDAGPHLLHSPIEPAKENSNVFSVR